MHFTGSDFWRFLPLVHAGVFGATAVVGRMLIARTNRHDAVSFSRGDSAHDLVARCFYFWLPVVDGVFGWRASAWYRYDGGWVDRVDPTTGAKLARNVDRSSSMMLRLVGLWQPASGFTVSEGFR